MDFLVKFASAFMGVFQLGGEQFMGWVTGIIPTILMLLVMMNAVIALIGDERIEVIAKVCTSNPLLRYPATTLQLPTTATPTAVSSPTSTLPRS